MKGPCIILATDLSGSLQGMQGVLYAVEQSVTESLMDGFTQIGLSLGAACAMFSMISLFRSYLSGMRNFDWMNFFRPILLLALVGYFNVLVVTPLRAVTGVYNTRLVQTTGASVEEFKALYRQSAEALSSLEPDTSDEEQDEASSGLLGKAGKVADKVVKGLFGLGGKVKLGLGQILSGILFFLLNISLSIMMITSHMFLMILTLLGPVTFAIGIIPQFRQGIVLWIERFVQFTLWEPLLYLVMYIGTQILIHGNASHDWGGFWTWCFMCLSIFTMIRLVPSIASYIIEGPGNEGVAAQMSGSVTSLITKVASVAGLK